MAALLLTNALRAGDKGLQSANQDQVLAAAGEQTLYLKVQGRGSFKQSPSVKQYCSRLLSTGIRCVVIDFESCTGLDSTFMGVLAGLASQMGPKAGGLVGINVGPKTSGLLETLGLDQVIKLYGKGEAPPRVLLRKAAEVLEVVAPGSPSALETARTMLEAHECLVELSPENQPKFKDVLEFIREDIQNLQGGQGSKG